MFGAMWIVPCSMNYKRLVKQTEKKSERRFHFRSCIALLRLRDYFKDCGSSKNAERIGKRKRLAKTSLFQNRDLVDH